jgi:hypothetical protein
MSEGRAREQELLLPGLFSLAVFLSAGLLFLVQPMVARMLLPLFGGAAAVWQSCLVFYQGMLLLGYLYAHALSRLSLPRQWLTHGALLLLVMPTLPIHFARHVTPADYERPVSALLWRLGIGVGPAFFALSGTGVLLQGWFGRTDHPSAADPYFLYAASNLGSVLALLSYPFVVEPSLGLAAQGRAWTWGFAGLVATTLAAGALVLRTRGALPAPAIGDSGPSWTTRLEWTGLVFVPTSLMMGVSLYLTTDIAPVPLLWVAPLGLYFLAFVLAFARLPAWVGRTAGALSGPTVITLLFFLLSEMHHPMWLAFLLHLGALFLLSVTYLGRLAATRPPAGHLTTFYLCVSVGGALAGIFNALVAPLLFATAAEYLLMLLVAVGLLHAVRRLPGEALGRPHPRALAVEAVAAAAVGLLCAWLVSSPVPLARVDLTALGSLIGFPRWRITTALTYAVPVALCLLLYLLGRATAFALSIAAVAWVCIHDNDGNRRIVRRDRSFFAVLTVADDPEGDCRHLVNGRTPHGRQFLKPGRRSTPLAFYVEEGPIGDVFHDLRSRGRKDPVAVIGLGAGTLASYGEPAQRMTFYEIDPAVARIARDPLLFTYLSDSPASVDVVLGDARLRLADATPGGYGLIVVDAFSSDAIPTHLLTREAIRLYIDKLAPGGLIAIHISNRYLELSGLAANLAADAGLVSRLRWWRGGDGCARLMTTWVVMAREERDLGALATTWAPVAIPEGTPLWTDDYSNIASLLTLD